MGSRKSIIREAIERLDSLMAIGQSRFQAKQAQRATSPEAGWTISTGKIHSHTTRRVYQQHVLAFINWARTNHGITRLAWLDERAGELVTQYLAAHVAAGRSAYTVQTERAALRLFFGNWSLAATVEIPRRTRSTITRSRVPASQHIGRCTFASPRPAGCAVQNCAICGCVMYIRLRMEPSSCMSS